MKNQFKFPKLSILLISTGLMLSYSCKKDEPVVSADVCASNAKLFETALNTYASSPTKANCEAYKASVKTYLDSCPVLTTAQRTQYTADLAAVKCPQ